MIENEDVKEIISDNTELPTPEYDNATPDTLPVPIEDEFLPDITEDTIFEEMTGTNSEGFTRSTVLLQLAKVPQKEVAPLLQDDNTEINIIDAEEKLEEVFNTDIERCTVEVFTLDLGETINLILEFDNPLDCEKQDLLDALEQYKSMMSTFMEADGKADYPVIRLLFAPTAYPGQGVACFSQPFAFFETLSPTDSDHRRVQMTYHADNVETEIYHLTKEQDMEMRLYVKEMFRKAYGEQELATQDN